MKQHFNQVWLPRMAYTIHGQNFRKSSKKGVKNFLVICPGFASDCVETLEEINIQGRESFLSQGGKNFDFIPCLNDNSDHVELFEKLIKYI